MVNKQKHPVYLVELKSYFRVEFLFRFKMAFLMITSLSILSMESYETAHKVKILITLTSLENPSIQQVVAVSVSGFI